ncbi:3-dehydroquinate synthase II [Paenibacillus abyssi]|uniref:3-dehydroquinate synthase C-terminal domain-containing protein n=1 Tax=Paenibacillus abyssi TaxID=1340531 RepID=A0A917CVU9_9BACL|nr:3-dehydroquinate synthase II [Paenibacillus abyssi]GGG01467.1 hypothetical protein GCM10010916_18260 [Paenibacillus abyssi]
METLESEHSVYGTIHSVEPLGEGMRVCVDMIDFLQSDEGVLVGNTGHGYVLVLAETRATETYPSRPFRINCGAVHQYMKQGERTSYLSELVPGAMIEVYSPRGSRQVALGRIKIEKRSFVRVEIRVEDKLISASLQNSESVHVWTEAGEAKPVTRLQSGDRVLCLMDEPGRHLGMKVTGETIEL